MAYCLNCRNEFPEGAEELHQAPCNACPSDGHSPCQHGEELECLERHEQNCTGPVERHESLSGSGTLITRCRGHREKALKRHQEIQERYPDSSVPPSWFDPAAAGERWNDDY